MVCANPCEWLSACHFFLVPFRSSNTPFYHPKVLRAKEHASTPYSFVVFTSNSHLSLSRNLGVCKCECTITHDMLQNIVATNVSKNGIRLQREASHLFPCHTHRWMYVIITRDYFWILADVVFTNPIHTNLVQHASTMTMHVTIVVVQNKTWFSIEWTLGDDFIPFATKIYSFFHLHFDSFYIFYVHVNITCH